MTRLSAALAILVLPLFAAAGCGDSSNAPAPVEFELEAPGRDDVRPADFAVLACNEDERAMCLLVMAGGKRLLFGVPAGISAWLSPQEMVSLDGVFLLSLRPESVEGLDELRNRSWQAGRPGSLPITGPAGLAAVIDGLNLAYEGPDALSFVEDGAPAGGFDAALLSVGTAVSGEIPVFDTGDLKVRAVSAGTGHATYAVTYRDLGETWHELIIRPCGGPAITPGGYVTDEARRTSIGCAGAEVVHEWPLAGPVYVVQSPR